MNEGGREIVPVRKRTPQPPVRDPHQTRAVGWQDLKLVEDGDRGGMFSVGLQAGQPPANVTLQDNCRIHPLLASPAFAWRESVRDQ